MTPEEIKASIRDAISAMVKNEPEDQERSNALLRQVIQVKSQHIVNPQPEVDLTTDPTNEPTDPVDPLAKPPVETPPAE